MTPQGQSPTAGMAETGISFRAGLLIRLQIGLEYGIDHSGFLVPFPGATEQARFIIHRHRGGYERYYRHD